MNSLCAVNTISQHSERSGEGKKTIDESMKKTERRGRKAKIKGKNEHGNNIEISKWNNVYNVEEECYTIKGTKQTKRNLTSTRN